MSQIQDILLLLVRRVRRRTDAYFTPDWEAYYASPDGDVYSQPNQA